MTIEELKKAKTDMEFEIGEIVQKFMDTTEIEISEEIHLRISGIGDTHVVEEVQTALML